MSVPLAERIRPKTLDDIVGQTHLLGENKPLRRIIESGKIPNMILRSVRCRQNYGRKNDSK